MSLEDDCKAVGEQRKAELKREVEHCFPGLYDSDGFYHRLILPDKLREVLLKIIGEK